MADQSAFRNKLNQPSPLTPTTQQTEAYPPKDANAVEEPHPPMANMPAYKEPEVDETDKKVGAYLQAPKAEKPEAPNPTEFDAFYKKWKSLPLGLSTNDKKMFQDKLSQLDQKMIDAEESYKKTKNANEWAEVAETLGHAMVQLMAGADASKNNWNIKTVGEAPRTDWERRMDRSLREFDSRKDTIGKQQGAITREMERGESEARHKGEREQDLITRDYFTTQARIAADAKRDARGTKDENEKLRKANETAKKYAANYEAAEDSLLQLEKGGMSDKDAEKLRKSIVDSMRKNGHLGTAKNVEEKGSIETGGFLGFFKSHDYSPLKQYIQANKKAGIENVYKSYGVAVPADSAKELGITPTTPSSPQAPANTGAGTPNAPQPAGPGMVRMQDANGRIMDIPSGNVEKAKQRGLKPIGE